MHHSVVFTAFSHRVTLVWNNNANVSINTWQIVIISDDFNSFDACMIKMLVRFLLLITTFILQWFAI